MPQREPARHQTAGEPPRSKVKMRRDENGRWVAVRPEAETTPTTEAAKGPPAPDHPRIPPTDGV
jgi:hypothetical protein